MAALVRLWGIDYGLPCTYCRPDEDRLISTALRLSLEDPNPHYFIWPGLFFYSTRGILEAATLARRLFGGIAGGSPSDLYREDPAYLHLILRYIFCGFGVATVYLLGLLGKRIFSPRVGLLAAFFLALSFLHVRDSHFAMLDIPVTLLAVGFFLAAWSVYSRGRWGDYLRAGAVLGLAVATKYYAVLLAVPLITAHLSRSSLDRDGFRRLFTALTLGAVLFALASPYTLLDAASFAREIKDGIMAPQFVDGFHLLPGLDPARGWLYHITFSLRYGMGWPLEILALAGVGYGVWRMIGGKVPERLILSFFLVFYLALSFQKSCFIRYTTMLLPFLYLLGAVLLARISPPRMGGGLLLGVVVLVVLEPAVRIIRLDGLLSRPDTRLTAGIWIRENISPESVVIFPQPMIFGRPAGYFHYPHRITLPENADAGALRDIISAPVAGKKYAIVSEHPLAYSRLKPEMKKLLGEMSDSSHTITGDRVGSAGAVYDPFDAFYVPLAGFRGVDTPGPTIRIYDLTIQ